MWVGCTLPTAHALWHPATNARLLQTLTQAHISPLGCVVAATPRPAPALGSRAAAVFPCDTAPGHGMRTFGCYGLALHFRGALDTNSLLRTQAAAEGHDALMRVCARSSTVRTTCAHRRFALCFALPRVVSAIGGMNILPPAALQHMANASLAPCLLIPSGAVAEGAPSVHASHAFGPGAPFEPQERSVEGVGHEPVWRASLRPTFLSAFSEYTATADVHVWMAAVAQAGSVIPTATLLAWQPRAFHAQAMRLACRLPEPPQLLSLKVAQPFIDAERTAFVDVPLHERLLRAFGYALPPDAPWFDVVLETVRRGGEHTLPPDLVAAARARWHQSCADRSRELAAGDGMESDWAWIRGTAASAAAAFQPSYPPSAGGVGASRTVGSSNEHAPLMQAARVMESMEAIAAFPHDMMSRSLPHADAATPATPAIAEHSSGQGHEHECVHVGKCRVAGVLCRFPGFPHAVELSAEVEEWCAARERHALKNGDTLIERAGMLAVPLVRSQLVPEPGCPDTGMSAVTPLPLRTFPLHPTAQPRLRTGVARGWHVASPPFAAAFDAASENLFIETQAMLPPHQYDPHAIAPWRGYTVG
ncbi:MAG: hypothetical protein EOO41_02645, partial [Methanobacteriota archaeon]